MSATEASTASAPAALAGVISSDSSSQPTTTATTGFTYAARALRELASNSDANSHTSTAQPFGPSFNAAVRSSRPPYEVAQQPR
jgi:hypothetical protein